MFSLTDTYQKPSVRLGAKNQIIACLGSVSLGKFGATLFQVFVNRITLERIQKHDLRHGTAGVQNSNLRTDEFGVFLAYGRRIPLQPQTLRRRPSSVIEVARPRRAVALGSGMVPTVMPAPEVS